jgi:ActR/RegA family two-component response regulator
VLVSGDTNLRAKAEAVHALGYIAKPADANAVARVISNLERRHAWATRQGRVPAADR